MRLDQMGAAMLFVALAGGWLLAGPARAADDRAPVALTVELRRSLLDDAGRIAFVREERIAVRKDGARAEEVVMWEDGPEGNTRSKEFESRTVWDVANGRRVSIFPMLGSKTTASLPPSPPAAAGSDCSREGEPFSLAKPEAGEILGYPVVELSFAREQAEGSVMQVREWRAPALDCFPLRRTGVFKAPDGAVKGRNRREAESVALGSPDLALFEIPEDYVERTPSEIYRMDRRRAGKTVCRECGTETVLRNADVRYLLDAARSR